MAKIKIEISDWLYNAGIVGLYKILENSNDSFLKKDNYLEFEEEALENFGDKYFNYLIEKYENFTTLSQILSENYFFETMDNQSNLEKMNQNKEGAIQFVKNITEKIDYMKSKVNSNSYKSAYKLSDDKSMNPEEEIKKFRKLNLKKGQYTKDILEDIKFNSELYINISEFLERKHVKKYILAKNIIYDVVDKFWSGVYFLHKSKNNEDMYNIVTGEIGDKAIDYMRNINEKSSYSCMQCQRKINKLADAFETTFLNRIGVDSGRKSSHFWNYTCDSYTCAICNLIYCCVPAGFNIIAGQGLFINDNSNISNLISINNIALRREISLDEMEQENYYNIVNIMKGKDFENASKQIGNIQVIKYDSNNKLRPYTFNVLGKDKLLLIERNYKELSKLLNIRIKIGDKEYINVYYDVLQNIYNNKNQFSLISRILIEILKNNTNRIETVKLILTINDNFMKGKGKMIGYKKIEDCQKYGEKLKKSYLDKNAENKIVGISYKLINALRTKNTAKFTDTVLNAYMYLNEEIPSIFIDSLKDDEKLQTIGYAFLLGLQGEVNKNKEGLENE